ncbi:Peptidase family M50 [Stieleria maiorica]|uniref:Peptidase family M50 n=1 Tax=Stieleria maiorica TaxID=2795974 RepID=A0A5B9MCI7_9BACT|nr:site-2 protease family protein [Stieleria maiorica]QEF99041.1 Peptidase family M50 [Stieleria maiorica]
MDDHTTHSSPETDAADPLTVIVQVDPAVEFSSRGNQSQTVYVGKDRRTGKYYRFGAREYHAVSLMDGRRTLGEIHRQLQQDGLSWTEVDVIAFVKELVQHRLAVVLPIEKEVSRPVETADHDAASADASATAGANATQPSTDRRKRWAGMALRGLGGLLTQRFPLADGDRVAAKLLPAFGGLFSAAAMAVWTVLVVAGVGVVWSNADAFSTEVRRVFDQQLWLVLALLWCVLKIVHECGHAVCAKRHGVRVGRMGIMFFLFAPLAYVDVTDAWKLVRRRDRVQIALAGVYVELAIGAVAALIWWISPVGFAKHLAAQVFLVAGPATLLVNANPLLRLDGYYVLSDLLEIPNLRAHGRKRLGAMIECLLFRIRMPESPLVGWRRDFAAFHALCSVVFQIVWMSGLVFAVATWAKGLGILIAIIAATMWGVLPLLRWMVKMWTLAPREGWTLNFYQRRLIGICTFIALIIQFATVHSSPLARRVPVVVQFQNEQIARAPVDAFVASVFVQCGDRVQRGTLLMELEQPELVLRRDQLIDQRDVESAKAVQHRQRGELALSKVAQQNAESLDRRLAEIDEQIDTMRILATRDGKITTPATDHLLGRYVKQGEELLRVSDPQEKEIMAIVAEDNLEAYKKAAADRQVASVRLRGGVTLDAPLRDLQPSASRRLPHPALAATAGGPLAVQMLQPSEDYELVHPQLRSVLPLNPLTSLSVQAGQIGRLTIPDDRSLVSRLWDHLQSR